MSAATRRDAAEDSRGVRSRDAVASRRARCRGGATAAQAMRGVFIILNTPFHRDRRGGLGRSAREVAFVDRAGCAGIVWPQGSSGVTTLTKDERLRGMEVLAKAVHGKTRRRSCSGCRAETPPRCSSTPQRAEALGTDAMIAMPPTTGTSMDDYRAYFRALGGATRSAASSSRRAAAPATFRQASS